MKSLLRSTIVSTVLLIAQSSFAAMVFETSTTIPLEDMLKTNCPWIKAENVQEVGVLGPQEIGKVGGTVGKLLGKLGKSSGVDINTVTIGGNLPENTQAILFNVAYYTNSGLAEVVFHEISTINSDGMPWGVYNLPSAHQQNGGTYLVCFDATETPVVIKAVVSHVNVDGSRPTIGITSYQKKSVVVPLQ